MKYLTILLLFVSVSANSLVAGDTILANQRLSTTIEDILKSKPSKTSVDSIKAILVDSKASTEDRFSAAKALALINNEASINALIENINVKVQEPDGIRSPSVEALALIGKNSVPYLLRFIEKTDDKVLLYKAVNALLTIKGKTYADFVEGEKKNISPKAYDALLRYGIY